ncbi:MAG: DUF1810 family protein, partial [Limnobacter sp.]|nr:DUF1810 family protein [Limnobacter sp.]
SRQKPVTLGNGYTLESATIDSLLTKDIEVPYLRGTLAVRDPAGHTQTVHTLELAPQFDGAALNSKALLQCFNQIQDFKATVNPHSSEAHYASHKSHLRGPALMVLDGFNQLLVAKHPPARLNPPIVVDRLIAQVRETIGPAALHDKGQVRELHLACQDLATQSQAGKSGEVSSNQSVDSSASTVKVANLPPPFQVKFKRTKPVETPTQPQATPKQTVAPRAQPSIPVKKVTFSLSHELAHFEQAQRGVSIKTTQGTIKPVPFRQAHRQLISGQIKPQSVAQLFPQLKSLGNNGISRFFGIKNLDQAKDYLQNPTLRDNLDSASKALLSRHLKNKDLSSIEGLDVEKIQASMTLFSRASEQPDNLYKQVLNTHFKGKEHLQTLINLRIVFEV